MYRLLAIGLCLLVVGCGGAPEVDTAKKSNDNMQEIIRHGHTHRSLMKKWPGKLDDLVSAELISAEELAALMKNPLTGDDPGYEYVAPSTESHVVLYQLRGGKRDTSIDVGYDDGTVGPLE